MPSTTSLSSNKATFGARRGMWLDQVFRDSEMKGEFFRVMYAITVRLNTKTFTASTSDPDLAALAQVDTKTAQRARECAVKRGHISQVFHGCKGTVITPLLASKPGQIVQVQDDEGGLKPGLKPGLAFRVTHGKTRGNDSLLSDSQDSHKYKKESGLPREAKYVPFDSPNWGSVESLSRNLPPTRRPIKDRRGGFWVSAEQWRLTQADIGCGIGSPIGFDFEVEDIDVRQLFSKRAIAVSWLSSAS